MKFGRIELIECTGPAKPSDFVTKWELVLRLYSSNVTREIGRKMAQDIIPAYQDPKD